MSLNKIILEALAKNPIGLKESLSEVLSEKIAAAIERKMEESTQLDELSGKTLGSYIHKATMSREKIQKDRDANLEQRRKVAFDDREMRDAIGHDDEAHKIHRIRQDADDATKAHLDKKDKQLSNKSWNRDRGVYTAIKKLGKK